MPQAKVAVIGAGSYVFGASILQQAFVEHRLDGLELALMDVHPEVVGLMGRVGQRLARELGLRSRVSVHTDRDAALDGADFVLCAAAAELRRRLEMDCDIVARLCPGHWVTEFGGVAGISYSLRQIALVTGLAEAMKRRCPSAWLLNSANPLPRVCQAAHECGVRTAGFCSVAVGGLSGVWHLLHGKHLPWPPTRAEEAWNATMAGVNHFSWLVGLRDKATGADLLPELRRRIAASGNSSRSFALARETGYLPMSGDSHIRDFLEPLGPAPRDQSLHHGTAEEREARLALLRDVADGRCACDPLFEHPAWERPMDLVAAMAFSRPCHFHALNLINDGQVPGLPRGVFVETPAEGTPSGPVPQAVELPASVLPYGERTARVTDAIVRAAAARSRRLLREAVELDPTILDKRAGLEAVNACLEAHADLLPAFGGPPRAAGR